MLKAQLNRNILIRLLPLNTKHGAFVYFIPIPGILISRSKWFKRCILTISEIGEGADFETYSVLENVTMFFDIANMKKFNPFHQRIVMQTFLPIGKIKVPPIVCLAARMFLHLCLYVYSFEGGKWWSPPPRVSWKNQAKL